MDKNDSIALAQTAGGTYLGYQGIKHGLPRTLGIRIEYHTTNNKNAAAIKQSGNILDPAFGSVNGCSQRVNNSAFVENSKDFIHITGTNIEAHKKRFPDFIQRFFMKPAATIYRKVQGCLYQTIGNLQPQEINKIQDKSNLQKALWYTKKIASAFLNNKTTKFCIPGIDSYFNSEFIPDTNDVALKSSKKVKVYNNRFSAMIAGLKQFGLKGIKENKSRSLFGLGILSTGLYSGYKLIDNGIHKFNFNK